MSKSTNLPVALAAHIERARHAIHEAMSQAQIAVRHALIAGHLLIEIKELVGHGQFEDAVVKYFPEIDPRRARRWMDIAARSLVASGVEIETRLLSAPSSDLTEQQQEDRQTYFDFTNGKTLKELRECVVDGEDAHRITRAHNGRTAGGTKGEDRRDWPVFIRRKLSDISTHLRSWRTMTGAQTEAIEAAYKIEISKWPAPLLETLKKTINDEIKSR